MKTLILSDLHLGSKASRATAKLNSIARVANTFDRVVFNGDTLDRCYVDPRSDEIASHLLKSVNANCGSHQGPPELLSGNHDPAATVAHHVYDEESQTLIYHGDIIEDCTHPTKDTDQQLMAKLRERWDKLNGRPADFDVLERNYREVQLRWLPEINPYKHAKTGWQYIKTLLYPPRRPFDVISYWWRAPGRVSKLAQSFSKPVKRVVVGHTHRSGHWRFDNREVFNTGSFMPFSTPMAAIIEGESIRFQKLDQLIDALPHSISVPVGTKNNLRESVQSR